MFLSQQCLRSAQVYFLLIQRPPKEKKEIIYRMWTFWRNDYEI